MPRDPHCALFHIFNRVLCKPHHCQAAPRVSFSNTSTSPAAASTNKLLPCQLEPANSTNPYLTRVSGPTKQA
ncbi:hypothetical protein Syun_017434 [Stephania yunnanensis]|uniref:Uncharacterized protein n=1 Tax=Stephania yunnanensis TaxID=152371 RepID=A0AAP0J6J2_9MAGN